MAKYKLVYKKSAVRDIQSLSSQIRRRLRFKLEFFIDKENPLDFAEPLKKPADAQYRYRVGDYRIVFDVEDHNIVVLRVQHRREVHNYLQEAGRERSTKLIYRHQEVYCSKNPGSGQRTSTDWCKKKFAALTAYLDSGMQITE
jgi:mRNA interferase RelE/StbE